MLLDLFDLRSLQTEGEVNFFVQGKIVNIIQIVESNSKVSL